MDQISDWSSLEWSTTKLSTTELKEHMTQLELALWNAKLDEKDE